MLTIVLWVVGGIAAFCSVVVITGFIWLSTTKTNMFE